MRLLETTFKGVTVFVEKTTIDYDSFGPGLIALVGLNGSGKTSATEAAPASIFKRFPTRPGAVYDWCEGSTAFIESVWQNGDDRINVNLKINATQRKTEGYIKVNGKPVTDGKAASFTEIITLLFGTQELFLASVFAAQDKSGNFFSMKKGDRKALFAQLLMLGNLEALADSARGNLNIATTDAEFYRRKVADYRTALKDGNPSDKLEQEIVIAKEEEPRLTRMLEEARTAATMSAFALAKIEDGAADKSKLEGVVTAALKKKVNAERALEASSLVPTQLRVIAARRRQEIADRDTGNESDLTRSFEEDNLETRNKLIAAKEELEGLPDIFECNTNLTTAEAHRDAVKQDWETKKSLTADVQRLDREIDATDKQITRDEAVATLIDTVPCTTDNSCAPEISESCKLLNAAFNARERIGNTTNTLEQLNSKMKIAEEERDLSDVTQEIVDASVVAVESLLRAMQDAKRGGLLHEKVEELEGRLIDRSCQHASDLIKINVAVEANEAELVSVEKDLEESMLTQECRVEECQADYLNACDEFGTASENYRALATQVGLDDARDKDAKNAVALKACGDSVNGIHAAIILKESALVSRLEMETLEKLESDKLEGAKERFETWKILADSLGQNGIQAYMVDAAAPEVAEIANHLLESCHSGRFSLRFETVRLKKDKSGYTEVFDCIVYDRGQPRPVEGLSGGERVIVGEAVGIALAIFNSRKSDIRYETLWRDETAGALDPENAAAYVEMLRSALKLGGFHQVIFVAHLPQVYEAADLQLYFDEGKVGLEKPKSLS